jgi:hypothetical protein
MIKLKYFLPGRGWFLTFKKIFYIFLIIILFSAQAVSQRTKSSLSAGEQRHAERGLKHSRYFFTFINSTVSNSGTSREKELFTEAAQRDLIARILYMKFQFHDAFVEVKRSQALLIELMQIITAREKEDSTKLLNEFAPYILKSGDKAARKYLSLGYRSSNEAEKVILMADNLPEKNYSIRLYEYVKALKLAKYARRYALISMIETSIAPDKKGKTMYNDYDKKTELIKNFLKEDTERLLSIHADNYYKIKDVSFYDLIMSKPELEKIPEYEKYRKEE